MIQRLILGIITVALAFIIGLTVYTNFNKGILPFAKKTKPTPTPMVKKSQPSLLEDKTTYQEESTVDTVKVFFIALGDNGIRGKRIGCGDSVVGLPRKIQPTTNPLKAVLETLLSTKVQFDPQSGLYNALYQSDLQLQSVEISKGGVATIQLIGTQALSGVCDDPRLIAQLQETALQFSSVTSVAIFINGYPIEQLLSGR